MPKANVLRRLKIREVSSVDRGAGEGVRIMLMKRQLSEGDPDASALSAPSVSHITRHRSKKPRAMTLFQHQASARQAFTPSVAGDKPRSSKKKPSKKEKLMAALTPALEAYLKRNVIAEAEAVTKREFSGKERRSAAARGHAMPDGGYPIESVGDLSNAIQAIGRAKNPDKTRSHVRRQAARLGRTDLIPESWGKKTAKKEKELRRTAKNLGRIALILKGAVSFDEVLSEMSSTAFSEGVIEAVRDACHALKDSIESIADCDDLGPNEKSTAIGESYDQFMTHLAGVAPGNIVKAFRQGAGPMASLKKKLKKAFTSVGQSDAASRDSEDKKPKNVTGGEGDERVAEAGNANPKTATTPPGNAMTAKKLRKAVAGLEDRVRLWKSRTHAALTMDKAAKDYLNDPENDMDEDDKAKFLDASPKDRAKMMEARPLEKMIAKRIASLPEPVRKQLEAGNAAAVEIAKMTEQNELVEFGKRAVSLGQSESFGVHLRTLAKGLGTDEDRTKAYEAVETALAAYAAQAKTAGLFSEFGSGLRGSGSAADQLMAKADALMAEVNKTAARKMTKEMAFDQVYTDPANADLVKQYKNEQRRAAA